MYVPNVGNNTMQLGCDQSTMIQRKCAQVMNVEDTMYKINAYLGELECQRIGGEHTQDYAG